MLVNSMWVTKLEAEAMAEDNSLNPHAHKSTSEILKRAKHYGLTLDWS